MEKATLIVKTTKKGKTIAKLHFPEKNKTMPSPQFTPKNDSQNGMEVEVERIEGKIVKVQAGEKLLYLGIAPKSSSSKRVDGPAPVYQKTSTGSPMNAPSNAPLQTRHIERIKTPAYAPYNFVPLPEKVVEAPAAVPRFDTYHPDRRTGWIDVGIETVTPLYIRGTVPEKDAKQGKESRDISTFFSPGGQIRIPGSSLRGMIRTLLEITSYGRFERVNDVNDTGLYYRGLADKSNLHKEYQSRMSSYDRKRKSTQYKMSAGFLSRDGFNYFIGPTTFRPIDKRDVEKKLGKNYKRFKVYPWGRDYLVVSGNMPNKKKEWVVTSSTSTERIPIPEIDVNNYKNDTTRAKAVPDLIVEADKKKDTPCFYVRWKDATGEDRISFGHTPMFRLAYQLSIAEHVPEDVRSPHYRMTPNGLRHLAKEAEFLKLPNAEREELLKQFHQVKADKLAQPQFEKQVDGMLKETSQRAILKPLVMKHARVYDIPEAIFGNETTFAGRVFFEDAPVVPGQKEISMAESIPKVLGSPKTTTFQHYLVQKRDDIRELNHYNSPAAIRGHKLYWHKTGENWQYLENTVCLSEKHYKDVLNKHPDACETFSTLAVHKHNHVYFALSDISLEQLGEEAFKTLLSKDQKNAEMLTKIQPVRPGVQFEGRIRFENLSDIELGALLFSLTLPKGCYHKLGMGKPLGLGSVNIVPSLYLSDRQARYRSLLSERPESMKEAPEKAEECLNAFETYVAGQLGVTSRLWETERLKALHHLLDYEQGRQLELRGNIGYMSITATGQNDFKNRPILPLPAAVCAEAFDDTRIRIETKTYTTNMILQRIQQHGLDISAGFHRQQPSWDTRQQSRFIEALLTNIPTQVVYIDHRNDDKWLVVDGRERLCALERFVLTGELSLCDLEFQTEFEGKTFRELPPASQRRITETRITLNLIEKPTPEDMIFTLFRRLNSHQESGLNEVKHD